MRLVHCFMNENNTNIRKYVRTGTKVSDPCSLEQSNTRSFSLSYSEAYLRVSGCNSLYAGLFFMFCNFCLFFLLIYFIFLRLLIFFKSSFSKKNNSGRNQIANYFGSRSNPISCRA